MKKRTITFILLISFLQVFSQKESGLVTFSKQNYQIQYPKNWQLDTSKKMGTEFFILMPMEDKSDKFSENVNLLLQDLRGQNIDLAAYKKITDKQLAEIATDCKVFESSIIKKEGKEFYKVSYAMTQGLFRLRIISFCFIKNEKAYVVTFTSKLNKYEQYKKVGEEILTSFTLKNL